MKVLIIGGTRFVGPLVVDLLLKNKHEVTIFNRGSHEFKKAGVKFVKGDRDKGFNIKEKFDVVLDNCSYTGAQTERAIKELVFDFFVNFGTVASYQVSEMFPLTEQSHLGKWPIWDEYNVGKVEGETVLAKSRIKYATVRPTYILGEYNYMDRENFIYSKIKKGEKIVIPGNGEAIAQFVFAGDVAKAIVKIAEKSIKGAFNLVGDEQITLNGLVNEMSKIVGKKAVVDHNPNADGEKFKEEEFPFANENLIVSNFKAKEELGIEFIPLLVGLKRDYQNYYSRL